MYEAFFSVFATKVADLIGNWPLSKASKHVFNSVRNLQGESMQHTYTPIYVKMQIPAAFLLWPSRATLNDEANFYSKPLFAATCGRIYKLSALAEMHTHCDTQIST